MTYLVRGNFLEKYARQKKNSLHTFFVFRLIREIGKAEFFVKKKISSDFHTRIIPRFSHKFIIIFQ